MQTFEMRIEQATQNTHRPGQKYFNILSKAEYYLSKIHLSRQFSLSLLNVFVVLEYVIATTITLIMSSDVATVISDCLSQLVETVIMDFG